jgi:hypothetical protein
MLTASIGSSIDRATFSTAERIRNLLIERFRGMADHIDREATKPGPMRDKLREIGANFRTVANNTQFLAVDFDAIADQRCRKTFHSIDTSWALPGNQLDGLNVMGEALLAQNPDFPKVLTAVNARPGPPFATVEQACAVLQPGG